MHSKDWDKLGNINTARVLIADDDEATRILLRMSLTQWGYEPVEAKDGEEAWNILIQPNPPQILTLDWLMPKLDGIQLCKRIEKELNFHPYIIFLTRMEGTENMMQGLEAGADEFILKPFDLAELRIRVFAGERIIKYRHELDLQKKQLQHYVSNMKQIATEYLQKHLPIQDIIKLLQEIMQGLTEISLNNSIPEMNIWIGKTKNLISLLKEFLTDETAQNHRETEVKKMTSVPAQQFEQEDNAVLNLKRMEAFFGKDKAGIKDFIKTFINLALQQINEIDVAIQNQDVKNAKYFFHLLGSASGNSGMMQIYDICGKGETSVTVSEWQTARDCCTTLSNLVKQLEEEVNQL